MSQQNVPVKPSTLKNIKYTGLDSESVSRINNLIDRLPDKIKNNISLNEIRKKATRGGNAQYFPDNKSINIQKDFMDKTFYHELWHHIRDMGETKFPGITKLIGDEESIADTFADWAMGKAKSQNLNDVFGVQPSRLYEYNSIPGMQQRQVKPTATEVKDTAKPQGEVVARNTERKMRSDTGEEADYITEYQMVEDKQSKSGYPWQLRRTFKVGDEVREDNVLLEEAMTPEELAEKWQGESSYDKAEKFGTFKEQWDTRQTEKQAKEKAESDKAEKEYQDRQRYNDIYKKFNSIKGVKKSPVSISTVEEGKSWDSPPIRKSVDGYDVGNGIGIAISGEGKNKDYTVTHLNSGLAMGNREDRLTDAIALAKAVAQVDDWSKYQEAKDIPKDTMSSGSKVIKAFKFKSMDEDTAKIIQSEPVNQPTLTQTISKAGQSIKELFTDKPKEPDVILPKPRKPRLPKVNQVFNDPSSIGKVRNIKGVGATRRTRTGKLKR